MEFALIALAGLCLWQEWRYRKINRRFRSLLHSYTTLRRRLVDFAGDKVEIVKDIIKGEDNTN